MKINQLDFSGGMSALLDITKTAPDAYRFALNARIRKNAIEPAYRHIKYNSPSTLHQAIFSNDSQLALIAGGQVLKVDLDDNITIPIGGASGTIDPTAARVYHQAIPAPTNWLVNNTYQPTVASFAQAIVLQDSVNQPILLFPDFSYRAAKTYDDWTYEDPEYIPIGSFMAWSDNKLFIANGSKIFQSVSGRAVDFVININNNGDKQGTADTTALAATTSRLTALQSAQGGGLLAFTKYSAHGLTPQYTVATIFGEPYYVPNDIFPVGAVNDLAFAFANGESLFISPAGIQAFNQVLQVKRTSNATPYGAKIIDYIIRPVTETATAMVDDYTFIALNTIFGPAVLVHDNVLNTFVGFDLTDGLVKEFATIEDGGLTRLFYITATGLYEIPIYDGTKATAAVYFGEYSSGQAAVKLQVTDIHLGFNRISQSGEITCELWTDKVLYEDMRQGKTLDYSAFGDVSLLNVAPQRLPLGLEMESKGLSFDTGDSTIGYSSGIFVTIGADARLVSLAVNVEAKEFRSADPQVAPNDMNELNIYGYIEADEEMTGQTEYAVARGRKYVLYAEVDDEYVLNANERVFTKSGTATVFTALTDIIRAQATAYIYDYSTFLSVVTPEKDTVILPVLGGLDVPLPLAALLAHQGISAHAVLGASELSFAARAREFYGAYNSYSQMRVEYDNANVFLFSDVTANLAENGPAMSWLIGQVNAFGVNKFNICCFARSPYCSLGTAATDLRWPFEDIGVQLVIGSNDVKGYERAYLNGVHYITNAAGSYITRPGGLKLSISSRVIQATFGNIKDQFTVLW